VVQQLAALALALAAELVVARRLAAEQLVALAAWVA
jgi:hypothetical protein